MIDIILYAALTYMPRHDKLGWWSQAPGGFESVEHGRANTVGVGIKSNSNELRVSHTSAYSQFVAYTRDDANYDTAQSNGCRGECLPTTWGYNRQTNTALSALRRAGNFGLGADLARVDWRHVRHFSEDGDYSRRFTERYHTVDYTLGVRFLYRYGPLEFGYARDILLLSRSGVCCPPSKQSFSIGVSAPIKF